MIVKLWDIFTVLSILIFHLKNPTTYIPIGTIYCDLVEIVTFLFYNRIIKWQPQMIAGFKEDTVILLDQRDMLRIYAANSKVQRNEA